MQDKDCFWTNSTGKHIKPLCGPVSGNYGKAPNGKFAAKFSNSVKKGKELDVGKLRDEVARVSTKIGVLEDDFLKFRDDFNRIHEVIVVNRKDYVGSNDAEIVDLILKYTVDVLADLERKKKQLIMNDLVCKCKQAGSAMTRSTGLCHSGERKKNRHDEI